MSTFSERIKKLRKERKILSKEMAALLNITPRNYQRYEKDEIDPPTSKTVFLADYFGVSLDYLVGRTNNPKIQ